MFGKKQITPRRRPSRAGNAAEAPPKRPNVFSYRARRSAASDNLGRGKSRPTDDVPVTRSNPKKHYLKRLAGILALFVLLLVIGNNMLLRGANPEIVLVGTANTYRSMEAYRTAAAKAFGASPFNANKVTVNVKKIEEQLRQEFPELADVSVSLPFIGREPTVYLQPSNSRLIIRSSANESFVLDENGRATATGQVVTRFKEAGLPEVQDQSEVAAKLGYVAIPSTSVDFITEVVRQLKAKNIDIAGLTLLSTPSELQLRISGEGYFVKLNTRGDARVAVGSFLALKAYLEAQGKKPGEYIDVRIENRAYYK